MNANQLHQTITELLRDACTAGQIEWSVLAEWERQWENCQHKLPVLEAKVQELQDALKKSLEPPLSYSVFLRPAPGDQREVVVGTGNTRLEVHLADNVPETLDSLRPGQELVLNKDQNVVAVRDMYASGETAEVINILKPDQAGEVLEVVRGARQQPLALRVRWREGDEIELDCTPGLSQQPLKRGDIVQIDPDHGQAVAKVRPRLHVRAGGQEGIIVEISDLLFEQGVQIGDIVRIEPGLKFAFEKLPAYETGGLTLEDIPDVSYEDIGGLTEQIEQVYDAIELPYLYRAQFEAYQLDRPKGLLLYGPPGCGKTMIAKAVANSLTRTIRDHLVDLERRIMLYNRLSHDPTDPDLLDDYHALMPVTDANEGELTGQLALDRLADALQNQRLDLSTLDRELQAIRAVLSADDGVRGFFLNVKGPELLNKYVGETEHRIRKIFEEARQYATFYTPVVIFFDEMESMFRARGSGRSSDVETTIVPQFLAELDGVEASENLIIIGASNRSELIDPAIMRPGRLDIKIKVDRPTREAAQDIFALYLLPTLPLDERGVLLPEEACQGPGALVFRQAYRKALDTNHTPRRLEQLARLLPDGCDFRLAHAITPEQLATLADLSPHIPVREAIALLGDDDDLGRLMCRFKAVTSLDHVIQQIGNLQDTLQNDTAMATLLKAQIRQEWVAETMIFDVIQLLYSPSSLMNVLTNAGNRYTFYIKDFTSGAVIANIVARAKKSAVKRVVMGLENAPQGISLDDLHAAAFAEFDESKDQLVQNKLSSELGLNEQLKFVELTLQTGQLDLWNETKLRPYETFAG